MASRFVRFMVGRYYRTAYRPEQVVDGSPAGVPPDHHLAGVPWIATDAALCQSTALQMIAASHGIIRPRRHFDFLMGFTYGANYRPGTGLIAAGVDPEVGLLMAAPYLGLVRRYFVTDDPERYLRALRAWLAAGFPVRVPLDMGCLYARDERLPHNEVLVGYDDTGFFYYEPVSRPPAPCLPGAHPPGEQGLRSTDELLLRAVARESQLFNYPWVYPFVVFVPGPTKQDLEPVWRQNGTALVGGRRRGQITGASALERTAEQLDDAGGTGNHAPAVPLLESGLEVGSVTRPDNANYLREAFPNDVNLGKAADHFDSAGSDYQEASQILSRPPLSTPHARRIAGLLRHAAQGERAAGLIFLEHAKAP